MSTTTLTIDRPRTNWLTRVVDYVELTKPRIGVLVLVTVAAAYTCARWGQPDPTVLLHILIGTLLVASSASALNQCLERRLDLQMDRTADRPLPSGRLRLSEAVVFAVTTFLVGTVYLAVLVNLQVALWGLLTWVLYVWVYTPLKMKTPLNTAVGAVAGAMPILIGWSAAEDMRGSFVRAFALFTIVFLWQFPHFMAIAWIYRKQYGDAGMKMLPVVDPTGRRAGIQAVASALALLPISLLLGAHMPGLGGFVYISIAFVLGVAQLAFAIAFCVRMNDAAARRLLKASLVYLPTLLMLVLLCLWI
ncbi:MAG: protoheme IX farnesyltransferase [Planctomycetaceae bacterium]|nr:protoheme IX farnesyltransferase [Planctomycetaceae bacterium]